MISHTSRIEAIIQASVSVKQQMLADPVFIADLVKFTETLLNTFRQGGKVLLCGNGGSAADALHIAAELSGRFYLDREPLFAEALNVNPSALTAISNDYGYEAVFERMVKAMGREGDVLIGLSTSGNSQNVVRAVEAGNALGMHTIGLTGSKGGKMKGLAGQWVGVPSDDTPRIQEAHILIGHIVCELVEAGMFSQRV